jgi:hypothetical protein
MIMKYNFTEEDFAQAFEFAVEYYLDPTKAPSGRTSAEPRGFGAVLDAFTRGKLVEIGIQKLMSVLNEAKEYALDFEMHSAREVTNDPDIVKVMESGYEPREPKVFVEIKNTSMGDRWIGVTEEQLESLKRGSGNRMIYFVYASLRSESLDNPRTSDFVGMYLKHISGLPQLDRFAELNASAHLEFIITEEQLKVYGTSFPQNALTYETNLFCEATRLFKTDGTLAANISLLQTYPDHLGSFPVLRHDNSGDEAYGMFDISGSFDLYIKTNPKSVRHYIHCLSDVTIKNEVFGKFSLEQDKSYYFNLETLGRDPVLKRNNIFIAKRRIYQLIEQGLLEDPVSSLQEMSNSI